MKGKISIPKKSRMTTMPKAWVMDGYTGKVPFIANASTIVLIHPKASLDDTKQSLLMILQDLEIREKLGLDLQYPKKEPEKAETD